MASVDEEQTTAGAGGTQNNMQSVDGVNISRTSRTGSGSLSTTAILTGMHNTSIPNTRAERSSAALYTAILNRVDHIQK